MLKIGDTAPDFLLENDEGKLVSLKDFRDKLLVLYFYPKDNTPGCTGEAVDFSELKNKFLNYNAQIVGVSPDSVESHKKFKTGHNLDIMFLSDVDKKIATDYFVYGEKKNYGKTYMGIIRSTFIIENGLIKEAMYNVKAKGHAEKVFCKISQK